MERSKLPIEVTYGIGGGILYVFATFILYLLGPEYFINPVSRFIAFIAMVILAVYAGYEKRKMVGTISFTEAAQAIFFTFLIIELCWSFFYFALFNIIDPDFSEDVRQFQLEMIENMEEEKGEELSEEQIEMIKNEPYEVSWQTALESFLGYSIFGLIISLIGGGFLKNDSSGGLKTLEE